MTLELKGETDPEQVRELARTAEREAAANYAAGALKEHLRRMSIWLRGLDTGSHCYGIDADGQQVWRRYRAKRIVTLEGVAYDYVATLNP